METHSTSDHVSVCMLCGLFLSLSNADPKAPQTSQARLSTKDADMSAIILSGLKYEVQHKQHGQNHLVSVLPFVWFHFLFHCNTPPYRGSQISRLSVCIL